jgi:hypothetical protein
VRHHSYLYLLKKLKYEFCNNHAQDCALVFSLIKGTNGKQMADRSTVDYNFGFVPRTHLRELKIGYFK